MRVLDRSSLLVHSHCVGRGVYEAGQFAARGSRYLRGADQTIFATIDGNVTTVKKADLGCLERFFPERSLCPPLAMGSPVRQGRWLMLQAMDEGYGCEPLRDLCLQRLELSHRESGRIYTEDPLLLDAKCELSGRVQLLKKRSMVSSWGRRLRGRARSLPAFTAGGDERVGALLGGEFVPRRQWQSYQ